MFVDLPQNTASDIRKFEWSRGLFSIFFLCLLLLYGSSNVCSAKTKTSNMPQAESVPKRIIVQFHDLPGVQFAGYIAALENGFYAEEGLPEVKFLWRNDEVSPFSMLANNQAHFATSWMAEGILARSQGIPVVGVALQTQGTSACVMIREDLFRNLDTISSLENKKVSAWFGYDLSGRAFLTKNKVNATVVIQRRETCQLFSLGYIHAMIATTWNNKPRVKYLLYRNTIRYITFKECGFDYPEETLYCNETFLGQHPDLCAKFVKATFRGWHKVLEEPDRIVETLAHQCSKFGVCDDTFVLRQQLDAYMSVFQTDPQTPNNGQCDQNRFDRLTDDLISGRFIEKEKRPAFHDFFVPVLEQASGKASQNVTQPKLPHQTNMSNDKRSNDKRSDDKRLDDKRLDDKGAVHK